MATINSYISDIQEYFNNGQKSDDFVLSNRLIYKELKAIRSKLLKEKIDKQNSKNISDSNYSNLYCIEMIEVTTATCPCIDINICKKLMRSKYKLPKFLSTATGDFVDFVRNIDFGTKYFLTDRSTMEYSSYRQYSKNSREYFIENGYLFINDKNRVINMRAVFEDVIEVEKFNLLNNSCGVISEEDKKCTVYDIEFNIDNDLEKSLKDITIQTILKHHSLTINDTTNDAKNNQAESSMGGGGQKQN
ncbi:MAG: hypothetical protein BWX61_00003 [Bacteroidetes bacterium ADurb.Bin035]|jgi:hypothetical protein|nr:MAG: hypothetical protein BWX61_00003 [Bacteroidetes bacterium ADurb.Bin035]